MGWPMNLRFVRNVAFEISSLQPTVRTWKWMVGIRLFPFRMAYFQVRTVSFRECILRIIFLGCCTLYLSALPHGSQKTNPFSSSFWYTNYSNSIRFSSYKIASETEFWYTSIDPSHHFQKSVKLREPLPLIQPVFFDHTVISYGKVASRAWDLRAISRRSRPRRVEKMVISEGIPLAAGMNHMNWDMWVPLKNSRPNSRNRGDDKKLHFLVWRSKWWLRWECEKCEFTKSVTRKDL